MNVRLADGTVRCHAHFDASSYVSETSDPCLYCEERGGTITIPVIMHNPETGDTVGAYQEGCDVEEVMDSLESAVTRLNSLWRDWTYVALV